jgi:hypothetical protein
MRTHTHAHPLTHFLSFSLSLSLQNTLKWQICFQAYYSELQLSVQKCLLDGHIPVRTPQLDNFI